MGELRFLEERELVGNEILWVMRILIEHLGSNVNGRWESPLSVGKQPRE